MTHRSDELLQDYLDDLLGSEAPPVQVAPRSPAPEEHREAGVRDANAEKQRQLQKLLNSAKLQVAQVAPQSPPEPEIKEPVPVPSELEPAVVVPEDLTQPEQAEAVAQVLDEQLQWHVNGRPHWAQDEFEVLLFKVSGLTLAVPLITLGQIQPLTDELTPLFGQADWFMGLQPTPSGKVRTVNTAKFVMPERYDPEFVKTAQYVISINGVPWGLAVDKVEQPIRLNPEDVKWRSERGQRPWLAGTVKAHMCALLDIPQMGHLLTKADKNAG
ncbi:chemotaxis protein CheW [Gilvimarinus xylanilyticus]|uniref:Chemotaxis protein CheW n=1 Tax=Gilvimarinus xylanilyticus TaxID=2944139 RepID=A0A9X2KT26_9GAMM|nr:chemotaxis protein CheW [Gilvimarinus xylanilyticus]MCP8898348.1 chemotaxis protein CheW [Gilvimarinus xylanilyticus]